MSKDFFKISINVLFLIISAYFLKLEQSIFNIFGIIGLYGSIYFLVSIILEKKLSNWTEIITIVISYNLQKERMLLNKEVYKNKFFLYINIFMLLLFLGYWFFKNYRQNKKFFIKTKYEILSIIYHYLILILPLYIVKGRDRFVLILMALIFVFKIIFKEKINFRKDMSLIIKSIFFLMLFTTTSILFNDVSEFSMSLYKKFMINLFVFIFFLQIEFKKENIKDMKKILIVSSVIPIIPLIAQLMIYKGFAIRLGDTNPNVWAAEAALWSVLYFYMILIENKIKYSIFFIMYFLGVLSSGSKGGLLGVLIPSIILIIIKFKKDIKKLGIAFIIFCIISSIFVQTNDRIQNFIRGVVKEKKLDNSSHIRLTIYKESIGQFLSKPINGVGFGDYKKNAQERQVNGKELPYILSNAYSQPHAHNNILQLLSSTGILGFSSYIFMIFALIKTISFKLNEKKWCLICLILVFEVCGLVDCPLMFEKVQRLLFFFIGFYLMQNAELKNRK